MLASSAPPNLVGLLVALALFILFIIFWLLIRVTKLFDTRLGTLITPICWGTTDYQTGPGLVVFLFALISFALTKLGWLLSRVLLENREFCLDPLSSLGVLSCFSLSMYWDYGPSELYVTLTIFLLSSLWRIISPLLSCFRFMDCSTKRVGLGELLMLVLERISTPTAAGWLSYCSRCPSVSF